MAGKKKQTVKGYKVRVGRNKGTNVGGYTRKVRKNATKRITGKPFKVWPIYDEYGQYRGTTRNPPKKK